MSVDERSSLLGGPSRKTLNKPLIYAVSTVALFCCVAWVYCFAQPWVPPLPSMETILMNNAQSLAPTETPVQLLGSNLRASVRLVSTQANSSSTLMQVLEQWEVPSKEIERMKTRYNSKSDAFDSINFVVTRSDATLDEHIVAFRNLGADNLGMDVAMLSARATLDLPHLYADVQHEERESCGTPFLNPKTCTHRYTVKVSRGPTPLESAQLLLQLQKISYDALTTFFKNRTTSLPLEIVNPKPVDGLASFTSFTSFTPFVSEHASVPTISQMSRMSHTSHMSGQDVGRMVKIQVAPTFEYAMKRLAAATNGAREKIKSHLTELQAKNWDESWLQSKKILLLKFETDTGVTVSIPNSDLRMIYRSMLPTADEDTIGVIVERVMNGKSLYQWILHQIVYSNKDNKSTLLTVLNRNTGSVTDMVTFSINIEWQFEPTVFVLMDCTSFLFVDEECDSKIFNVPPAITGQDMVILNLIGMSLAAQRLNLLCKLVPDFDFGNAMLLLPLSSSLPEPSTTKNGEFAPNANNADSEGGGHAGVKHAADKVLRGEALDLVTKTKNTLLIPLAAVAVVGEIGTLATALKSTLELLKSSYSKTLTNFIHQNGFDKLMTVNDYSMQSDIVPSFAHKAINGLMWSLSKKKTNVPQDWYDKLQLANNSLHLTIDKPNAKNTWFSDNLVFGNGQSGITTVMVYLCHGSAPDTIHLITHSVDVANFHLAPDILVWKETESEFGGAFTSSEDVLETRQAALKPEDVKNLLEIIEITEAIAVTSVLNRLSFLGA